MIHLDDITFDLHERERFRSGDLIDTWCGAFPQLFTHEDVRITDNQRTRHYYEWLSAVRVFARFGYLSLIEKYHCKNHPRANGIFEELVPAAVLSRLARAPDRPRTQPPDLFCYAPNRNDWFFAEVKGPGDKLRTPQEALIRDLEEITSREVRYIRVARRSPGAGAA
jgi:hypothetical protein